MKIQLLPLHEQVMVITGGSSGIGLDYAIGRSPWLTACVLQTFL